jgi:hypothetical protein
MIQQIGMGMWRCTDPHNSDNQRLFTSYEEAQEFLRQCAMRHESIVTSMRPSTMPYLDNSGLIVAVNLQGDGMPVTAPPMTRVPTLQEQLRGAYPLAHYSTAPSGLAAIAPGRRALDPDLQRARIEACPAVALYAAVEDGAIDRDAMAPLFENQSAITNSSGLGFWWTKRRQRSIRAEYFKSGQKVLIGGMSQWRGRSGTVLRPDQVDDLQFKWGAAVPVQLWGGFANRGSLETATVMVYVSELFQLRYRLDWESEQAMWRERMADERAGVPTTRSTPTSETWGPSSVPFTLPPPTLPPPPMPRIVAPPREPSLYHGRRRINTED